MFFRNNLPSFHLCLSIDLHIDFFYGNFQEAIKLLLYSHESIVFEEIVNL